MQVLSLTCVPLQSAAAVVQEEAVLVLLLRVPLDITVDLCRHSSVPREVRSEK